MDTTRSGPAWDDAPALVGTIVDHFRIESLLGEGGMGAVFKAFDTRLERWVALKRLALPPGERRAEFSARFEREARLLSMVNHPNVAQVHSTGSYEGTPYYVMEYVEGRSLAEILAAAGRLSGSHCLDYLLQAARGLEAAFAQGVVHRDVKPSNLMLDAEGRIKVVDFGLARRLADDSSLTASDRVLGTPQYMAPEQALALEVDQRSDIYALGATFYHLFAGTPPFESETPLGLLLQHLQTPLAPLRERNPRVPEAVATIVERMLAKEPEERYPSYAELIVDLEAALAGAALRRVSRGDRLGPPTALGGNSRRSDPPVATGSSGWLLPVGLGIVTLLALFVAFDRSRAGGDEPGMPPRPTATPTRATESAPGASAGERALLPRSFAGVSALRAQEAVARAALGRLGIALDAWIAERGEPPPDLTTLREAFGLHPRDLVDPWGSEILYEPTWDGGYRLISPGPDRSEGNDDDLVLENGAFLDTQR